MYITLGLVRDRSGEAAITGPFHWVAEEQWHKSLHVNKPSVVKGCSDVKSAVKDYPILNHAFTLMAENYKQ
ncbi:hypothetical protein Y1Q_0000403 [Alligator mississippiensis]|uniref:Uncharacterized protein n=1 Tax=Alligator mississippiensis TaxID=8496 RepID=A0A151MAX8_ALLMI|nr:hypothetical protein Y1Q_0000403 [Alligator mississippiensis]